MKSRLFIVSTIFCLFIGIAGACTSGEEGKPQLSSGGTGGGTAGHPADSEAPDQNKGDAYGGTAGPDGGAQDSGAVTPGNDAAPGKDAAAGSKDAAAGADGSTGDAGPAAANGCCSPHSGTGCDDADIQKCVCDKLPDCCSKAWDQFCVTIVTQRYCDPIPAGYQYSTVNECVCGKADVPDSGWYRPCCLVEWTSAICDTLAENQCQSMGKGCT